ncbi:H-NS histone family protein [Bradyrhizobium japonicum]|uniref:H-NS histone family protein n=2 Tax=Bradyrhizobium japonicum TaxID=375 RepID=UPI0009B74D6D|nr:H-NS histone family protein [Bradyrhizobium japonicum]
MRYAKRFELLNIEELRNLHTMISQALHQKIACQKLWLEDRLNRLHGSNSDRRPYPPVLPQYRNSDYPYETWTGRGRQPRWLVAQLSAGRALDDFRIQVERVRS